MSFSFSLSERLTRLWDQRDQYLKQWCPLFHPIRMKCGLLENNFFSQAQPSETEWGECVFPEVIAYSLGPHHSPWNLGVLNHFTSMLDLAQPPLLASLLTKPEGAHPSFLPIGDINPRTCWVGIWPLSCVSGPLCDFYFDHIVQAGLELVNPLPQLLQELCYGPMSLLPPGTLWCFQSICFVMGHLVPPLCLCTQFSWQLPLTFSPLKADTVLN